MIRRAIYLMAVPFFAGVVLVSAVLHRMVIE